MSAWSYQMLGLSQTSKFALAAPQSPKFGFDPNARDGFASCITNLNLGNCGSSEVQCRSPLYELLL